MADSRTVGASRIRLKRVYDSPESGDGQRILVDRLWPRGLAKSDLELDAWRKDVAPSTALRRWFRHDPANWDEFQRRYRAELASRAEGINFLLGAALAGPITLLYAAKDERHNQAIVLKAVLDERLK